MAKRFSNLSPASQAIVVDYFCRSYNYQATIPDPNDMSNTIPNPETPRQFLVRTIDEWPVKMAVRHRALLAAQTAAPASDADLT